MSSICWYLLLCRCKSNDESERHRRDYAPECNSRLQFWKYGRMETPYNSKHAIKRKTIRHNELGVKRKNNDPEGIKGKTALEHGCESFFRYNQNQLPLGM